MQIIALRQELEQKGWSDLEHHLAFKALRRANPEQNAGTIHKSNFMTFIFQDNSCPGTCRLFILTSRNLGSNQGNLEISHYNTHILHTLSRINNIKTDFEVAAG